MIPKKSSFQIKFVSILSRDNPAYSSGPNGIEESKDQWRIRDPVKHQ